ncbi:MAG: D-aminoacylase [Armatimonadota bacterium]|nr:D-aminoacylase [Armatimonadota bacterium]
MILDYLIKNGHIIDGTGTPAVPGAVGIKDGRIVPVGSTAVSAERVIDASGQVVCPGFIDMHSHTDATLLIDPRAESKVTQGITLEVCGQCGSSAAPVLDEAGRTELNQWRKRHQISADWTTLDDFLRVLESTPIAVNFATLVGHSNIRAAVVGLEDREASPDEIRKMKELAAEAMRQGAFGLSTGLQYPPSCFAGTDEIALISSAVGELGGIYASHTRNERERLAESDAEAIEIGRRSGAAVQISHHKGYGEGRLDKTLAALEMIREARRSGLDVTVDVYPYTASCTSLAIFLPRWAHDGGDSALLERLKTRRQDLIAALRASSAKQKPKWEAVLVSSVRSDANRWCEGLSIAQIAERRGSSPEETVLDLLSEEVASVSIIHFAQAEEDVSAVISAEFAMFGTDASARSTSGELAKGKPHPRAFGTFPRVLGHYVREKKLLPLETAVYKMTAMAARKLGLQDRGIIREGCWADLVVFDPNTVADTATYQNPHSICRGISYVFVNGELTVEHGALTDALAGKVIRKAAR